MDQPLSGMRVDHTDHDDPVLIRPDGTPVDAWRENCPSIGVAATRSADGTGGDVMT
ncbi:hypothetical protein [Streptomyces sp. NPDC048256]|uniref:hypothetical protein n=1 Tax=unclassified Streptomyces TaxID=2593676 RepID=UPI0033EEEF91